ncbi:MAG: hypothetical protein IH618_11535 [Ignavibacteriaceae bacterium]|nr:hypothetical protein [Ignavibacteriaceae bacterium]
MEEKKLRENTIEDFEKKYHALKRCPFCNFSASLYDLVPPFTLSDKQNKSFIEIDNVLIDQAGDIHSNHYGYAILKCPNCNEYIHYSLISEKLRKPKDPKKVGYAVMMILAILILIGLYLLATLIF